MSGGEDGESAVAAAAAGVGGGGRKRRMSKRERRNLRKKRRGLDDAVGAPAPAASSTAGGAAGDCGEPSVGKERPNSPSGAAKDAAPSSQQTTGKKTEPTLEEYMADYVPAPSLRQSREREGEEDPRSLGRWFPKASLIKSSVCYSNDYSARLAKERKRAAAKNGEAEGGGGGAPSSSGAAAEEIAEPKASLVLFYQYVSPEWSQSKVSSFLAYLTNIAKKHRTNIGGRIRVSTEGVNATVSAASTQASMQNGSGSNGMEPGFEAARTLRHFARDLRQFDPIAFESTDFKFVDGLSADRHFKELKLLPVKELVFYGIREDDCAVNSKADAGADAKEDEEEAKTAAGGGKEVKGGVHLEAKEYHEMLKRNDAVVIDVRNHYEAAIGRFDGQMEEDSTNKQSANGTTQKGGNDGKKEGVEVGDEGGNRNAVAASGSGGAEYIDPKMRKSTDFTSWLAEPETKQKLEGKTVMMFCTGGIRCERASAYLNSQMGSDVKGVYQLRGGIERYLQAFPEGGFWRGKNFVFDKREAIGAGNVNGDGGVVRKDAGSGANELSSKKKGKGDGELLPWGTECAKCKRPWDRYIGKRKCYTCGVPVLVCDACMSQSASASSKKKKKRKKKKSGAEKEDAQTKNEAEGDDKAAEENERVRCPLCVEEGVTVPAEDVEFTDNGIRVGRLRTSSFSEGGGDGDGAASTAKDSNGSKKDQGTSKAATSVLKWGGGHASKKKEKRKFSRRPCQFGADCVRKDCFFYHSERDGGQKKKVTGK